ncbi:hypothetical protein F975_00003 [Acinetobacter sp. ANC 3789]|jgi:hypothetical protein|nr:hypothetical protein F975_00003 [Acinetobacter sp. ANC 3789]
MIMKISVINVSLFCLCFLTNSYAASDEWSSRWAASSNTSSQNLYQANLIELRNSDYYSGLGQTTLNSTTTIGTLNSTTTNTTSIGTLDSSTNTLNVNGSNNRGINISNTSLNKGSIDSNTVQPINSNTFQNNQKCINLSAQPGVPVC